jgi:AraC family transcriptional regulator
VGSAAEQLMSIDAELTVPVATAQLVHFNAQGPNDNIMQQRETYWLDQCLTPRPRNARACYRNRWNPGRFEPLGHVFMVPPGETMQARGDGGSSQVSILCHLRPEALSRLFDGDLQWTDRRLEACLDIPDPQIRGLLLRLAQEMRQPGFASELLVELIAAQLAIELGRYCTKITDKSPGGGLAPWRLRRIDERLKELAQSPTLSELATLCSLSVRQLTRGFYISRGCSIGDHISNIRLDQAKRLLATEQSIKAIAHSLGFASPSSFCSAFRRATLQTPMQFRHRTQLPGE